MWVGLGSLTTFSKARMRWTTSSFHPASEMRTALRSARGTRSSGRSSASGMVALSMSTGITITSSRLRALLAHIVLGIVEPPIAAFVLNCQPPAADEGQQGIAGTHRLLDDLGKPRPWRDAVDVAKDAVGPEAVGERATQPARVRAGVPPAIADEDAAHAPFGHRWGPWRNRASTRSRQGC